MKKIFLLKLSVCFLLFSNAQYNSLCWKISGNGLKKESYLYGTMHSNNKAVCNLSPTARAAFENASQLALELDLQKINLISAFAAFIDNDHSLKENIADSNYHFLDSIFLEKVHLGLKLFDHVRPIMISTMLEELNDNSESAALSKESDSFLDKMLYDEAKKMKKKVTGLETADEQIAALNTLNYHEQIVLLNQAIDKLKINPTQNALNTITEYYLKGELDSLRAMDDYQQMDPRLQYELVTARNKRMADRIEPLILKKQTFIAIGALHLPGADGVIALLRKKGYTVEAVK